MKTLNNIPGMEPDQEVVIRKFTYGDKNKLSGKCVKVNMNRPNDLEVDLENYKTYTLVYGIVSAPFFNTTSDKVSAVENLDCDTGDYLLKEITEYNNMGQITELKKKSD